VVAVNQPSDWQSRYVKFSKKQLDLLPNAAQQHVEVMGK
jgi:hypothetical protein